MPTSTSDGAKDALLQMLREAGFAAAGVCAPDSIPQAPDRLANFLQAGRHGSMDWLETRARERGDPRALWPAVRSIVMVGSDYGPDHDPMEGLGAPETGLVSIYAARKDYHDVLKKRLKAAARRFADTYGCEVKVFVDTAPVMEKPLAEAAGVGWQGKHTNLVSREFGSWLFLGALYTDYLLQPDASETDHCGSCRACLDVCPTDAFPAPYELDATRCLAYWSIEHKGPIPEEFRAPMGNRIFGCDDCLAVCPWNKFAAAAKDQTLAARPALQGCDLADLAHLDDAAFRTLFAGTPVKRTGRDRFVRNVMIAIGNSGAARFVPDCVTALDDASPLVRGAAVWALAQLDLEKARAEKSARAVSEPDKDVRAEWDRISTVARSA
ncbi:MAG: tRNA epoxyqueuosine(34) reductase QueG [Pseudomonadota bacterium]